MKLTSGETSYHQSRLSYSAGIWTNFKSHNNYSVLWTTDYPTSIDYVLRVKTEKYMQVSPKNSSKGQTKTFLLILLAKSTASQCFRRLLKSRIQYVMSTLKIRVGNTSSLPGIQNLMNKKKGIASH